LAWAAGLLVRAAEVAAALGPARLTVGLGRALVPIGIRAFRALVLIGIRVFRAL
jgi:hypothetical protein